MTKKIFNNASMLFFFILTLGLAVWDTPETAAGGYPWREHATPYTFMFQNHLDTHQQTQLKKNGELFGFLYITDTGEDVNGIPIMEHSDASTPVDKREVGWIINGKPGSATFVLHHMDHPMWLVNTRNDIPQPGAFSHFHWDDQEVPNAGLLEVKMKYNGYFLELQAVSTFYFRYEGDLILISPGIDIASHVNIVGSFMLSEGSGH